MGVVETAVARDLTSDEMGFFVRFVLRRQLNLGHDQPLVIAIKLVDFKNMTSAAHKPARLVNHTRFAEPEKLFGLLQRDFLFELIAAQTGCIRRPLDGQKTTTATLTVRP